jgi:hypothetical protein
VMVGGVERRGLRSWEGRVLCGAGGRIYRRSAKSLIFGLVKLRTVRILRTNWLFWCIKALVCDFFGVASEISRTLCMPGDEKSRCRHWLDTGMSLQISEHQAVRTRI